jgi:hypothetical protein
MGLTVESGDTITVHPRDPKQQATTVTRSQVASIQRTQVSVMPPGLINSLNEGELRDLMAYIQSGGSREHNMFRPAAAPPPGQ